ncbi:MAG TPA: DUF885 domain-containing protein [Candidatus Limnocylindria bacterium]|nr:DUF885 domain-containing protein [Candidatus Limnocylindria bacterium]
MDFSTTVDALLNEYFLLQPTDATELGEHSFDHHWPDLTDAGHAAFSDWLRDAEARVQAIEPGGLSGDEAIDRRILLENLAAMRFFADELREVEWNPMTYVYLFGSAIFTMLAREYAPITERLNALASRLRGLPVALDGARAALSREDGRPVSRFHAEKAVERMAGVADLVGLAVVEAEACDDAAVLADVKLAAGVATAAIEDWTRWLRDELLPTVDGDFRLGPDLYAAKFRHSLKSAVTPKELEAMALEEYDGTRAEMTRIARSIWTDWMGDAPAPESDDEAVRSVLDAIAVDHPHADELLDFCRAENERIEAFVADRDVVGLTEEPMQIIWTPGFMRAFGGAMLIAPGPLDRGLASFFAITPVNEAWPSERRESYLREDNARMLRLLTIHEAVPGHYLQLAYSNRCPSLVRGIFRSGVFAEGWAVYITQVMMDLGYGADDPALMLVHWKFYLRAITNTLMDIRIQSGSMDEEEAMRLMVEGGFQEEGEATAKWDRARLSSTQLCEYFLGSVEMHGLEREARRQAEAEGRDFVYRPFLESVLAHGSPSLPVLRDILFSAETAPRRARESKEVPTPST